MRLTSSELLFCERLYDLLLFYELLASCCACCVS
jgi:hypothetical protein